MTLLAKARQTLTLQGPAALLRRIYRRFAPLRVPAHPFDIRHGTDTGGLIGGRRLATGHQHDAHSTAYWGTAPSLLRGILAQWSRILAGTPYTPADYTFIDLGCGKGRALLLASETPFRDILGIELNPALAAIARQNIALWTRSPHPCNHLEALAGDALNVTLPDNPTLLYIYNPFDAHLIGLLAARIAALAPTRHHPIDIVYARPEHAAVFEALPGLDVLWKGEIPFTPEDTAADAFATTQQQAFLYRLLPPQ